MLAVLTIVAPVFGLIAIGYAAGRNKVLSETAGQGIADFAFTLGIPALLCRTIATAKFDDVSPMAIWIAFFGAAAATWCAATILTRFALGRSTADAPSIAMSSTFGNTAMLGLPLAITAFGPKAAAPIALVLSLHAPLLWLTGMLHSEAVGEQSGDGKGAILAALLRDLVHNPIVIGIALGAAWRLLGTDLPVALDRLLELLAQSGIPASLIALGLTLVKFEIKGQIPTLLTIAGLKLAFMPAVAFVLASQVFALDLVSTGVITILAAMPTGANAFLFATREDRAVNSASGAVALGTVLAAVTAAIILGWLQQ